MKAPLNSNKSSDASGFTLFELVIVVLMISILVGFAITQIAQASQNITRANAVRELTTYIEKARIDSVRRHATTSPQMAQVVIINSGFYTVTLDANADGTLEAPRVISLPADSNLLIQNGPFPRSIMFNWRGRTVDSSGNTIDPDDVIIGNNYGSSTVKISDAGQTAIDTTPTASSVSNIDTTAPALRDTTKIITP